LHRDLAPLSIACVAPGHASIREELKMDGNAMVLGNILIGGLIGVAVDAASGAAEKFPEQITVLLDPSAFESVADRDRWYEKKKARIEKQALKRDMDLDNTEYSCLRNLPDCMASKEALNDEKNSELAKLEQVRKTATVRQASTVIDVKGQKTCLVQTGDKTWESRPCAAKKRELKRARIKVDGQDQCLVQVKPNTWESRPCPQ
jgi:hypothetical protein